LVPTDGSSPFALRWSLLQVEQAPDENARDGVCVCRFFHRYEIASIAGYRCIKLGTVRAPLRIRWIQRMPGGRVKPVDQRLAVEIRRYGFEGEDATKLQKESDFNGVLETVRDKNGVFDNVVFVRVISGLGEKNMPRVPIVLVDDQPVSIEVIPSTDPDSLFTYRETRWQREVADCLQMQSNLFKRLEVLGAKPENRSEIIQLANFGLNRVKLDRERLAGEQRVLFDDARKDGKELKTPLEDRKLKQLGDYEQALAQFITQQKKIEESENDPQLKKWLSEIERAKLMVKDLEAGEAIKIYERVQKEGFPDKDGKLEKYLTQLKKDWEPRNPEHKEARGFIYRVWPTLDLSRLEENIPKAKEAFKKCKEAKKDGDRISIQKLLLGTLGHADRLKKKLDELDPDSITDDAKEAQQYKPVIKQIADLGEEIQQYLKSVEDK
jgi:hypothetical protein